ncbi:MAG: hypothetical protein ILP13_00895, partial [Lachnospiraceae bacterium]|nr:hypothetical protein [Lachnospiraceae bacterium]
MKKNLLIALSIFIFCFLFAKADVHATGPVWGNSYGFERNYDGIITYNELENWQRENLRRGYNDAGSLHFQVIYNLSNPYIVDIANKNYIGSFHYRTYSHRIISYYQTAKFNLEIYPRETGNWFVTKAREDSDGVWHATVNCTSTANKLKTPETIYYDGHKCIVDTLDLRNCYVKELTLTDNITAIRCCQAPFLREVYGGINVERIDPKAFLNDVYLVNLPYFPSLKAIHEFAFLGCLNLKEVLLPPLVERISWNAFGWMDCILGNYDPDFGTDYYEEDYEYRTQGRYQEFEKVEGITLYAAKDTVTYATLQELFSTNDPRYNHLSFKEKKVYPGRASAINLDEVKYALEWIPPQSASDDDEWDEDETPSEPETPSQAYNALTETQRKCMDWLEQLYLDGEINEDMLIALTGAMVGVQPIPRDFLAKHYKDEEFVLLQAESLHASIQFQKVYKAREAG